MSRTLPVLTLLLARLPAFATSCVTPHTVEDALYPDSAVFIGVPVSTSGDRFQSETVFAVDEPLWGLNQDTRTITVRVSMSRGADKRFVIARRALDGPWYVDSCSGTVLPATHPWVTDFRKSLAAGARAAVPVRVVNMPSYGPVADARVEIEGNGLRILRGTDEKGQTSWAGLPPGTYSLTVIKPHYELDAGQSTTLSIPPGTRGEALIRLKATGRIHGQVIDHLGQPVHIKQLDLVGWSERSRARDYRRSRGFDTNANGEFSLGGVEAGAYYLGANIWGQNHPKRCTLPQVVYPGVSDLRHGTYVVIASGEQREIVFRLPDFGPKRLLTIQAAGADGTPRPGAEFENGPAQWDERPMSAIEEKKTDANGTATFDIWPKMEYAIQSRWQGKGAFHFGPLIRIRPGNDDVRVKVTIQTLVH